jgi:hypothetical protein
MNALGHLLQLIGGIAFITCIIWLHWRALQDGAIQDALLFLTGISIYWYIFNRWNRAKGPILSIIGASLLTAVGVGLKSNASQAWHKPSPKDLSDEVKR